MHLTDVGVHIIFLCLPNVSPFFQTEELKKVTPNILNRGPVGGNAGSGPSSSSAAAANSAAPAVDVKKITV